MPTTRPPTRARRQARPPAAPCRVVAVAAPNECRQAGRRPGGRGAPASSSFSAQIAVGHLYFDRIPQLTGGPARVIGPQRLQARRELLGDGHTAVLAARAAHRKRQIPLALALVAV